MMTKNLYKEINANIPYIHKSGTLKIDQVNHQKAEKGTQRSKKDNKHKTKNKMAHKS